MKIISNSSILADIYAVNDDVVKILSGGTSSLKFNEDISAGAYYVKLTDGSEVRRVCVSVKFSLISITVIGIGCEKVADGNGQQITRWVRNNICRKLGDTWKLFKYISEKYYQEGFEKGKKEVQRAFTNVMNM